MVLVNPNAPEDIEIAVTFPGPPEGGEGVSEFVYPELYQIGPDADVDTFEFMFATLDDLPQARVHDWMDNIRIQVHDRTGNLILCYAVYSAPPVQIEIPDQICVFGICVPNPLGGSTTTIAKAYKVWALSVPLAALPYATRPAVRAQWQVLVVVAVIAAGFILGVTLVGVWGVKEGKLKVSDFLNWAKEFGKMLTPGEQLRLALQGLSVPLIAFGFALVASSLVLGIVESKVSVSQPIPGGGRVEVGGTSRGGRRA